MKKIVFVLVSLIVLTSCNSTKSKKTTAALGKDYEVHFISGLADLKMKPTLIFDFEKNKVTGNAGCNRYSGDFEKNGTELKFGMFMVTKMYCDKMNVEKAFLKNLRETASYKIENNQLVFMDASKNILLTFNPKVQD